MREDAAAPGNAEDEAASLAAVRVIADVPAACDLAGHDSRTRCTRTLE
jgi:hypothetical protein